jgi:hypothetical protein
MIIGGMIMSLGTIMRRRRVLAVILLTAFGAGGLRADPAGTDQHVLFAPVPIGAAPSGFQQETSVQPPGGPVPTPKLRPAIAPRPVATTPQKPLRTRVSNQGLGGIRNQMDLNRPVVLTAPKPQPIDLSRGLDLGGVSLGLDTGHDNDGSGTKNLLSPEARDPVPSDPTLIKKGAPFLGLSLSAPTN